MKNKYIPMMIITFIVLAFAAFSTILNIIRQEIGSSIFSFIIAVLASCWFGVLVVAVIQTQERLKVAKMFENAQKEFLKKLEQIHEEPFGVRAFVTREEAEKGKDEYVKALEKELQNG